MSFNKFLLPFALIFVICSYAAGLSCYQGNHLQSVASECTPTSDAFPVEVMDLAAFKGCYKYDCNYPNGTSIASHYGCNRDELSCKYFSKACKVGQQGQGKCHVCEDGDNCNGAGNVVKNFFLIAFSVGILCIFL